MIRLETTFFRFRKGNNIRGTSLNSLPSYAMNLTAVWRLRGVPIFFGIRHLVLLNRKRTIKLILSLFVVIAFLMLFFVHICGS